VDRGETPWRLGRSFALPRELCESAMGQLEYEDLGELSQAPPARAATVLELNRNLII